MISVKNISKSYRDVKALDNFSYDFDYGIYAILGPNGSGKSTLMNILTDNIIPDSGRILFSGKSGTAKTKDQKIGYIPQYPGMYPNFTVHEMLDYIAVLNKAENREAQIQELMNMRIKRFVPFPGGPDSVWLLHKDLLELLCLLYWMNRPPG